MRSMGRLAGIRPIHPLAFALFRLGAVPVVDPGMGVRRMLHCYRAVGAEAFIGPPLAHLVRVLGPCTFGRVQIPVTLGRHRLWGGHTLAALRNTTGPRTPAADVGGDDLPVIGFTTGSTATAKGVEYTHRIVMICGILSVVVWQCDVSAVVVG